VVGAEGFELSTYGTQNHINAMKWKGYVANFFNFWINDSNGLSKKRKPNF